MRSHTPAPDFVAAGAGLFWVAPVLLLRQEIDGLRAGAAVHVLATDPTAPLGLPPGAT
ncbi:hypothetical protein ACWEP8_23760 [Streptomyces hydrogenans]